MNDKLKALPCRGCNQEPGVEKGIVFCNNCHVQVHGEDSLSQFTPQAIERWNKLMTRPVPDPDPQEGLRVALEDARIAGDIFKNSFEKAEAVIREARVLWGQGQEKQAVWKLESYLSGASSRTEAALASPKADHKTDGMTDAPSDAEIDHLLKTFQYNWKDKLPQEAFETLCAQAKRCNALERERGSMQMRLDQAVMERIDAEHDKGHAESERDALAKQVDSLESLIGDVQAKCMDDEILEYIQTALAKSQPAHVVESPTVSIDDVVSVYLPKGQPAEKEKP